MLSASSKPLSLNDAFVTNLYTKKQAAHCIYCHVVMRTRGPTCLTLCKKNLSGEYTEANVLLCCSTCSGLREEDYAFEEFQDLRVVNISLDTVH